MDPLRLKPLPSIRSHDESDTLLMEREGFVDEAVVLAILNGPINHRNVAYPEDLALAADDLDFAGWQLPPSLPFRTLADVPTPVVVATIRRATPPVIEEPGLGSPHHGDHRWWLAGLAGLFSAMLFSLLLFTLSSRPGTAFETIPRPGILTGAKPMPPQKSDPLQASPELTEVSAHWP